MAYTKGLADEMEKQGVALRESGAYVHRSFDSEELQRLVKVAHEQIEFEKELRVVITKGRGCQVREARVSKDGTLVKFLGGIVSLKVLGGEALSHAEFASRLKGLPGVKILRPNSGEKWVGILFGAVQDPYATLVDAVNGKMRFIDIEIGERSNNRPKVAHVLPREPADEARLAEVRRTIAEIAERGNR